MNDTLSGIPPLSAHRAETDMFLITVVLLLEWVNEFRVTIEIAIHKIFSDNTSLVD